MSFRVAVVGLGRMGKLHARVLSEMPAAELVCVVDVNAATAEAVAKQRGCRHFTDPAPAVELVDAAIIATPTQAHLAAARPFVQAGKCVLIEKPLVEDPAQGQELIDLAARTGANLQVGHTERFNPAVLAMKKYTIRPKFIEAHRISPYTFRSADVIGKSEDICNARLCFANGCVANLTASRLAVKTERKMRIFSEEHYLSVDYGKKVGIVVEKAKNMDIIQMARDMDAGDIAELAQTVDYTKLLKVEELVIDDSAEPLKRQAEAFARTVEQGQPPVCSAEEGLAAVRTAQAIVEEIARHRWDGRPEGRSGPDILRK
jgi:predicted dehydrogenase